MPDPLQPTLSSPTIEQIRHYATVIVEQTAKDPEEEGANGMASTLRTIEIAADKILNYLPGRNR